MRKVFILILLALFSVTGVYAVARDENAISRTKSTNSVSARTAGKTNITTPAKTGRSATNTVKRSNSAVSNRAAKTARTADTKKASAKRSATVKKTYTSVSRAATNNNAAVASSKTFGTGYNACRDAYFTCMDQFCANKDESYRRCVCSSRLEEIKNTERAISETSNQLSNFQDLNIDVINKTGNEVKAMLSATTGEAAAATTKDTSDSAKKLSGIGDVLSSTKTSSLSSNGKLDIAGDINEIWATTDLTAGASIADLTGEKLYNAVNTQCEEMATPNCESQNILDMVVSAYGMYIENDCQTLANSLDGKKIDASAAIRQTEYAMNDARLENYNTHNATSINDCISKIRTDITANTACGPDYVHCLDVTGQYLNRDTGEPIYSGDFYQLENLTSVSGDVLKNNTNRLLIAELERKKEFATKDLDTCRDISSDVWDEFKRQAITEIYQNQQEKIKTVKNECIDVVTECYDTKSNSLKDFTNTDEQLLLGARLELSEEMCKVKLETCSNLYGGATGAKLVSTMSEITNQTIGQDCKTTLESYLKKLCAVPSKDTVHNYPYSCRVYTPGQRKYASISTCNASSTSSSSSSSSGGTGTTNYNYSDDAIFDNTPLDNLLGETPSASICNQGLNLIYNSCNLGYYLSIWNGTDWVYNGTPQAGNKCSQCPVGKLCQGGTSAPQTVSITPVEQDTDGCGDYAGSLYQKLVKYALQACVRPTESDEEIPTEILEDVNMVMDTVKVNMADELSDECDRLGGLWVETPGVTTAEDGTETSIDETLFYSTFYDETGANKRWGYCTPTTQ